MEVLNYEQTETFINFVNQRCAIMDLCVVASAADTATGARQWRCLWYRQ